MPHAAVVPLTLVGYDRHAAPQFAQTRAPVRRLNEMLDERFVADARRKASLHGPPDARVVRLAEPRYLSASARLVSALVPVRVGRFPTWLGATVVLPWRRRVELPDLFADDDAAGRELARALKKRLLEQMCFATTFQRTEGLATNPAWYANFALTPRGLAVGFEPGELGINIGCGTYSAVVPYALLRRYLSPLGRALVVGAVAPVTSR